MDGRQLHRAPDVASFSASLEAILKPLDLAMPPLDFAMSRLEGKCGLALEFGVAGGASLRTIVASEKFDRVVGFDCWTGLPADWVADWVKGSFSQNGVLPDVPGSELVSGLFEDTVASFFDALPDKADLRLVHIDCDLYSSAAVVLSALACYLERAADAGRSDKLWVVFDELRGFEGQLDGELRALHEILAAHPRLHCFVAGSDQRPVVGELLQYYKPEAAYPFRVATYMVASGTALP
jgi:hypothetical protein